MRVMLWMSTCCLRAYTAVFPLYVPSFMSNARASAADVGIFAAGPETPTLWPLLKRISSVVPTFVPSRVIIVGR